MLVVGLVSCNDYLDVNKDPNNPETTTNELLIPSGQAYIAAVVGGDLHNTACFFSQYLEQAPEANQYNTLCEYRFSTDLFNRSYSNIYAGALKDLETVRFQSDKNPSDYYVATVLRAYILQVVVDYLDKAPYTEALQGNKNPMPKWDNGQDIYAGILKELDDAEAKLDGKSLISADVILGKDVSKWVKFANALRLKIYMRASNVQDNSAKIKALIDENNFFTGDVKFDMFSNEANKRNPWYETNFVKLANNHVGSYPIISYLKETEDPRLPILFKKATGPADYVGMLPGSKTRLTANKNSAYSFPNASATVPVYFYTQSELQLFLSEAYLRFYNNDTKAKEAYEAAIRANFTTRGMSDDASVIYGVGKLAAWNSGAGIDAKLKLIGTQKWVALCMVNNTEAWSEIRRMGYPALSTSTASDINSNPSVYKPGELICPWVNSLGNKLVKVLYYPSVATNLNDNTPDRTDLTEKVWWEKN